MYASSQCLLCQTLIKVYLKLRSSKPIAVLDLLCKTVIQKLHLFSMGEYCRHDWRPSRWATFFSPQPSASFIKWKEWWEQSHWLTSIGSECSKPLSLIPLSTNSLYTKVFKYGLVCFLQRVKLTDKLQSLESPLQWNSWLEALVLHSFHLWGLGSNQATTKISFRSHVISSRT